MEHGSKQDTFTESKLLDADRLRRLEVDVNILQKGVTDINAREDRVSKLLTSADGRLRIIESQVSGYTISQRVINEMATTISLVFNDDEFYELCMDMDINPEPFTRDSGRVRAHKFVMHSHRRKIIPYLLSHLNRLRSRENWGQVYN